MTTPTFTKLWPTQLMEIILPGHDQANSILADHIEELDIQRAQMTTDYLGDNLFDDQHPVVQWLNQSVQRAVLDYSQNLGIDYSLDFAVQAWANVNRMGDYHNLHNHPHAWLSGTYYVLIPEHDTLPSGRDDRTPNCISFFDPRPQANMTAIRGGRGDRSGTPHQANRRPTPFVASISTPSGASEPVSRDTRISVSFNVVLRWNNEYLPD